MDEFFDKKNPIHKEDATTGNKTIKIMLKLNHDV